MKAPINTPIDDKGAQRIERQETRWNAPRLVGLGVVTLGLAIGALVFVSHCQVAPLPFP